MHEFVSWNVSYMAGGAREIEGCFGRRENFDVFVKMITLSWYCHAAINCLQRLVVVPTDELEQTFERQKILEGVRKRTEIDRP